ncbi:MAG: Dps family protein, partial [Aquaspirillum sp.]
MDIGISDQNRAEIAEGLSRLLADTYTLYLKTHYNELALAVDLVAERIRSLGHIAPGTYAAYARLSSI